ncbi:MAG: hypothetical protein CMN86_19090 [Stappia sp.]|nr:hypothetical protein [Stappia sp.]
MRSARPPKAPRAPRPDGPVLRPLLFALVWSLVVTGCEIAALALRGEALSGRLLGVIAIFATGSLLGGLTAWPIARLLTFARRRNRARACFAAMTLSLAVTTTAITGFLFYLQFAQYYGQWHTDRPSLRMLWETIFTSATSSYIFAVAGIRPLLPVLLPALLVAALAFARIEPRRSV